MKARIIAAAVLVTAVSLSSNADEKEKTAPSIEFLTREQAAEAIVDDSMEPYFEHLQAMEMNAKTGAILGGKTLEEKREKCRERYRSSVQEFNDIEKDAIRWHVTRLIPVLNQQYPALGKLKWSFLKVGPNIEGGLPHTRGKHIVLSEMVTTRLVTVRRTAHQKMAFLSTLELLAHEQLHIYQRMNPDMFDSLYTDVWGFQKADNIDKGEWLTKHSLVNPDAVKCPWVLPIKKKKSTEYVWPLIILSEGDGIKRMPVDMRMAGVTLNKEDNRFSAKLTEEGKPVYRPLAEIEELTSLFPLARSVYHPAEAAADMFAKTVVFDNFFPRNRMNPEMKQHMEPCLAATREWFKKHTASP